MKKLVCNLKSGIGYQDFKELLKELEGYETKNTEIIMMPPYPYLNIINKPLKKGGQDISVYEDSHAVGETTGSILKTLDVEYVLVGHSDRRLRAEENEYDFIKKINNALEKNIKVIYCIGESREEKSRHKTLMVLEREIARVFNKIEGNPENIIIAYEPKWAISCVKKSFDNVNVSEISETISFIKRLIKDYYDLDIEVLYGGSVNAENIDQYRNLKSNGLLIGQASLNAKSIKRIVDKM